MDMLKLLIAYAGVALSFIATVNSLVGRRRMRLALGTQQFWRSQVITFRNAYKSARVWFDMITTPPLLIWVGYGFHHHFATIAEPLKNAGNVWFFSLLLLFTVGSLSNQLRPASVLILGASSVSRLKFQQQLMDSVFPFRIVSLIETNASLDRRHAAGHCFRTTIGRWDASVASFAGVVGVIILVLGVGPRAALVSRELRRIAGCLGFLEAIFGPQNRLQGAGCGGGMLLWRARIAIWCRGRPFI